MCDVFHVYLKFLVLSCLRVDCIAIPKEDERGAAPRTPHRRQWPHAALRQLPCDGPQDTLRPRP